MKQIDVAEAYRADGVAVIGAREREKFWPTASAAAAGIFVGELERDFHCGGAVVGEKNLRELRLARQAGRIDRAQEFFRQQRGWFIGEAERGRVGNFPKLTADGGVDFGMPMAV